LFRKISGVFGRIQSQFYVNVSPDTSEAAFKGNVGQVFHEIPYFRPKFQRPPVARRTTQRVRVPARLGCVHQFDGKIHLQNG
jgi:hypothetical protein